MDNWISVKDRLPCEDGISEEVIVMVNCTVAKCVDFGYVDIEGQYWGVTEGHLSMESITHWQPLPDPPGEK